jgi:hypothetical protein
MRELWVSGKCIDECGDPGELEWTDGGIWGWRVYTSNTSGGLWVGEQFTERQGFIYRKMGWSRLKMLSLSQPGMRAAVTLLAWKHNWVKPESGKLWQSTWSQYGLEEGPQCSRDPADNSWVMTDQRQEANGCSSRCQLGPRTSGTRTLSCLAICPALALVTPT